MNISAKVLLSCFLLTPKCQIQQFNLDIIQLYRLNCVIFQVEKKIVLTGNNGFESDFKERKACQLQQRFSLTSLY